MCVMNVNECVSGCNRNLIPFLCPLMQASKLGLTDSLHVWFTPVWATLDLSGNETVDGCDNEDVSKARAHTFGVLGSNFVMENTSSIKLVSGQVGEGIWWTAPQRVQHCLTCLHARVCVRVDVSLCLCRALSSSCPPHSMNS